MTAIGSTGAADASDDGVAGHLLSGCDEDLGQVRVQRRPTAAMVDDDHVPVARVLSYVGDTRTAGENRLTEVSFTRSRQVPVHGKARVPAVGPGEPHLSASERRMQFWERGRGHGWRCRRHGYATEESDGEGHAAEDADPCVDARQDSGVNWHISSLGGWSRESEIGDQVT